MSSKAWRYYVYEHARKDTGDIFYVGKGAFRKIGKPYYGRANDETNRNKYWLNVVNKAGGFTVSIIAHFQTDDDAASFEISHIAEHGRSNLVNLTDGGEGRRNGVFSESERQKRRENSRGKRSTAWVEAIRISRKNGGNGGVVKHGDKLPESWKKNLAKAKIGAANPMFGKPSPNCRFVVDAANGVRYPSITAAAKSEQLNIQSLHAMLTGKRTNHTTMRLI